MTKDLKFLTYRQQTIARLWPGTIHHFQVVPTDGSNNSTRSKDVTGLRYRVYRASGTCNSPGSFNEIADNVNAPTFEGGGVALASEHSDRFNGGTHQ
jgi:hypothetical protein